MTRGKMPKVRSLYDLRVRAKEDPRYAKLASLASSNLGGPAEPLDAAFRWLDTNARETDEAGVIDEVNYVRDLVKS